MPLSDTFVRQVKHSGKAAGDKHADSLGLYLLIKAPGKYWRMDYRFAGKRKTLALGVYPAVSLAKARKQRDMARERLAEGLDPSTAKQADRRALRVKAASTVKAVGDEWLALKRDGWSEDHYVREERNLRKDLYPSLGSRPISDVKPADLLAVLQKVEARGALDVAGRVRITAGSVWKHAIATGRVEVNIARDIGAALKPRIRQNYPALTEPQEVGQMMGAIYAYTGGPVVCAALKLAPILFQRPGNLRTMRWADVDMKRGLWSIPSENMKRTKGEKLNGKPHVVPLPTQAVDILRSLQPLTGHGVYVFPGHRDHEQPMSEAALSAALALLGYKGRQTWHGFRATGRTMLRQELKFPADAIEAQLAHVGQITHGGAYDRATHLDERTDMLQVWADYLDKLRQGVEADDDVGLALRPEVQGV